MLQYNDYALTLPVFSLLVFSLVLVICFGTHGECNDGSWIREDSFKGVFF